MDNFDYTQLVALQQLRDLHAHDLYVLSESIRLEEEIIKKRIEEVDHAIGILYTDWLKQSHSNFDDLIIDPIPDCINNQF